MQIIRVMTDAATGSLDRESVVLCGGHLQGTLVINQNNGFVFPRLEFRGDSAIMADMCIFALRTCAAALSFALDWPASGSNVSVPGDCRLYSDCTQPARDFRPAASAAEEDDLATTPGALRQLTPTLWPLSIYDEWFLSSNMINALLNTVVAPGDEANIANSVARRLEAVRFSDDAVGFRAAIAQVSPQSVEPWHISTNVFQRLLIAAQYNRMQDHPLSRGLVFPGERVRSMSLWDFIVERICLPMRAGRPRVTVDTELALPYGIDGTLAVSWIMMEAVDYLRFASLAGIVDARVRDTDPGLVLFVLKYDHLVLERQFDAAVDEYLDDASMLQHILRIAGREFGLVCMLSDRLVSNFTRVAKQPLARRFHFHTTPAESAAPGEADGRVHVIIV
jgi:hypothetical protein